MENIVYTIKYCPYCVMVKNLLKRLGVEFEERLIESHDEMMQLKRRCGFLTFPMVILNGRFIGGYDDTRALADRDRLKDILAGKD